MEFGTDHGLMNSSKNGSHGSLPQLYSGFDKVVLKMRVNADGSQQVKQVKLGSQTVKAAFFLPKDNWDYWAVYP